MEHGASRALYGDEHAMPTLAQIYEEHAEECARSAATADDPKRRDLLLKLASQWREDAQALRRGAESAPSGPPAPLRRNKR
jgi:NADPH-dependent ferric siderophore reductase